MPTLSIDLTEEEHRRLAEGAAKAGSSLSDFVRSRVLAEESDLVELASLLGPRVERADRGETFEGTISDIARAARARFAR